MCFIFTLASTTPIVHESKPLNTKGLVTQPGNEWGSYYNINMTQEAEAFAKVFEQVSSSDTPCAESEMELLRYYKSYDKPSHRIYSYFCRESKGYEHVLGDFDEKKLISFHRKLSDFKIYDAKTFPRDLTIRGKKDVAATAWYVWENVWNKFDVPEECQNPSVKGTDHVDSKYENYLLYYRFPLICSGGLHRLEVDIFMDEMFEQYFEGKPTLCFAGQLVSNLKFLEDDKN